MDGEQRRSVASLESLPVRSETVCVYGLYGELSICIEM